MLAVSSACVLVCTGLPVDRLIEYELFMMIDVVHYWIIGCSLDSQVHPPSHTTSVLTQNDG